MHAIGGYAENWRRQGGRGWRWKCVLVQTQRWRQRFLEATNACTHTRPRIPASPTFQAAFLYMTCHSAGWQSHVKSLANAISEIYNKIQTRKGSYRDVRCLSAIGVASEGLKTPLPPRFPSSLRAMRNLDIVHAMYCAEILRKPYRSHAAPACSVLMASPLSESMRPTSS
jgi:hypothetical protein